MDDDVIPLDAALATSCDDHDDEVPAGQPCTDNGGACLRRWQVAARGDLWLADASKRAWERGETEPDAEIQRIEQTLGPPPEHGWYAYDASILIQQIVSGEYAAPTHTVGVLRWAPDASEHAGYLFPAGRVSSVYGSADCGKTRALLTAARDEMADGRHVVFIDFEDEPDRIFHTLLADLQVPADHARERFHYIVPNGEMTGDDIQMLAELVRTTCPSLVVIDSTGEALAAEDRDENISRDVARWMRQLPTFLAETPSLPCPAPAVVLIDHTPKELEKVTGDVTGPIGSQRKKAALRGVAYHFQVVKPFSQTTSGYARFVCWKDKTGLYRHGQTVAHFQVDANPGTVPSTFTLLAVSEAALLADAERRIGAAIENFLHERGADGRTAIKGEIVTAAATTPDDERFVRQIVDRWAATGHLIARPCDRDCADPEHDGTAKRNARKVHYTLGPESPDRT